MRTHSPLVAAFLVFLSVSCSGDSSPTGPTIPSIVGTYDGTFTYRTSAPGFSPYTNVCAGRATVQTQSGGVFSGTLSQTSGQECFAMSTTMSGTISAGGALTMDLAPSQGPTWEEQTGCTVLSSTNRYTGSYVGGVFSAGASWTATCPQTGTVTVTWQINFSGS